MLLIITDVGAEPPVMDKPLVKSIRTADEAGGSQKEKGGCGQKRKENPRGPEAHGNDPNRHQQPSAQGLEGHV